MYQSGNFKDTEIIHTARAMQKRKTLRLRGSPGNGIRLVDPGVPRYRSFFQPWPPTRDLQASVPVITITCTHNVTLEVMMKRVGKAVAKNWWTDSIPNEAKKRKLTEWMPGTAPLTRSATPEDEMVRLEVKMSAILATPMLDLETIYKLKPAFSPTCQRHIPSEQLNPLLKQLGCALDIYLEQDRRPLTIFMGSKKQSLIVGLFNTFTSAEGKACAKTQLEALGNEEITQMAALIVSNAEVNKANDTAPLERSALDPKAAPSAAKKPVKAGTGVGSALGAKRVREDDGEVRSSKKMITDVNNAAKTQKPSAPEGSQSSKSSLAALLAEIDEPKKLAKAKAIRQSDTPIDPNESMQDRTRRLRKEERRRLGLRVTFKSDDRLVEVREFQSEEGEARAGNTRDVRSDRTDKMEGMALKKGLAGEIRPWEELSAADFAIIPAEKRKETFASRGGEVTVHTDQQMVMEEREKTELMVLYTDPADIPPTPKSPPLDAAQPDAASGTMQDVRVPDGAGFEEWHQRHRDHILFGPQVAIGNARHRLTLKGNVDFDRYNKAMEGVTSIAGMYNPSVARHWEIGPFVDRALGQARDFELFRVLASDRARTYSDPRPFDPAHPKTKRRTDYSDPEVQRAADFVEETVAVFARAQEEKAKLGGAQQDVVMTDAPALAQTALPARDYSAEWAAYYVQMQQAQAAAAACGQQPDVLAQAQAQLAWASQLQAQAPQSQANDLTSLLAQLRGGAIPPQQQHAQPAVTSAGVQELMAALTGATAGTNLQQAQAQSQQNADYLANYMRWAMAQAQGQNDNPAGGGQLPQSAQGGYDPGRYDGDMSQQQQGVGGGVRTSKRQQRQQRQQYQDRRGDSGGNTGVDEKDVLEHLRGIHSNLIGTKKCMFFAEGRCSKGNLCTFRHE
ncbi:hypothetical protein P8C59_003185 [Phyllachora maydis]|uniref:C3H1-type domain-containing protein n=1 Tax=Phyllachora maydis TaxID=1825666 RepID=A0AAD9MA35_9PEZI|nr:hypothetical protein P8C59_003185 [Phyllachora maydis]